MKHPKQQDLQTSANIPYPTEPRHAGQPWTSYHSDRHAIHDWGPSLTKQSEMESCDINLIIARHGVNPPTEPGMYGDFSDAASYLEAQNIIAFAQAQFNALDAKVRQRFSNDPAKLLEFVSDPENAEEMVKLGLATRVSSPAPAPEPQKNQYAPDSTASKTKKVAPSRDGAKAAQTAGEAD